jgi:CRP-like cAMP-binding protein
MSTGQGQGLLGTIVAEGDAQAADAGPVFTGDWTNVLGTVPLFTGLTRRHLRRVARLAEKAQIPRYTTIVDPRRDTDSFYVILDGEADVSTAAGVRLKLGPGRFFGEMALLDDGPRTAVVTATTNMLTMRISRRRFHQLLESEPSIAVRVLQELAARVRNLEEQAYR